MAPPRTRIRRTAAGRWIVTRPRLGFGPVETHECGTWSDAVAWADRQIQRQSTGSPIVWPATEDRSAVRELTTPIRRHWWM